MPNQSRYYPNQKLYVKDSEWKCILLKKPDGTAQRTGQTGDYISDLCMNTSGDPMVGAGGRLKEWDVGKKVACPPNLAIGDRLRVEWYGEVTCYDRGWAIKDNKLDVWTWPGEEWLNRILNNTIPWGRRYVYFVTK